MIGYKVVWEGPDKSTAEEIGMQKQEEGYDAIVEEIVSSRHTMYSEGIRSRQVEDLIRTPVNSLGYRVYIKRAKHNH